MSVMGADNNMTWIWDSLPASAFSWLKYGYIFQADLRDYRHEDFSTMVSCLGTGTLWTTDIIRWSGARQKKIGTATTIEKHRDQSEDREMMS